MTDYNLNLDTGMFSDVAQSIVEALRTRGAEIQQAQITGLTAGPPRSATLNVNGVSVSGVRIMDHVDPTLNEGVWYADMGSGRWLIIGVCGDTFTRPQFVRIGGDTMTGALNGTSAVFSSTIQGTTITATTGFSGAGGSLTALNATQLTTGTVPSARLSGAYTGITSVGTLGSLGVTGSVSAGSYNGDGSGLSNLGASALNFGTVPSARLSGSYTGITSVGTLGSLSVSGTVTGGTFSGSGASLNSIPAGQLTGTIAAARLYYAQQFFIAHGSNNGNYANMHLRLEDSVQTPGHVGLTFWAVNNGVAPSLRCYGNFGERLDAINSANSAYVSLNASAFTVQSSIRIKTDVTEQDDDAVIEMVKAMKLHRYRLKERPKALRVSERFNDVNQRWQAKGHTPLTAQAYHYESHDHDCGIDGCTGTAESPCVIAVNDTPRFGLIAEQVAEVTTDMVTVDETGRAESYDVDQAAALAVGAASVLARRLEDALKRIEELEKRLNSGPGQS